MDWMDRTAIGIHFWVWYMISFLESIELVISSLQRTQYDPHVASAHRFEMLDFFWFGRLRVRVGTTTSFRSHHHPFADARAPHTLPYLESIDVVRLRSMGMRARPKNPNVNATVTRNWMNTCVPGLT